MSRTIPYVLLMLGALTSAGCSKNSAPQASLRVGKAGFEAQDEKPAENRQAPPQAPVALQGQAPAAKQDNVAQPRKIRYTAGLTMIVEDFAKAEKELKAAIAEAGGDEARVEINSSANAIRTGVWLIRVPVKQLDRFRDAVLKLGNAERNTLDSEDMTAQYYDLDAHIKNRNVERETMRELLKEVGKSNLDQFLKVKHELEAITDDINRKEGMLRLWANLTDLTTVNVTLREKQKFITERPPEVAEVPTFGMRASKTFSDSWQALVGFAQTLALLLIAIAPWLPLLLVPPVAVWLLARWLRARKPPTVLVVEETAGNG